MYYVIICDKVDLSGGELLLEKIAKELVKMDNVRICCTEISNEMRLHLKDTSIEILEIKKWDNKELFQRMDASSEIRIITLLWDFYCKFSTITNYKVKTLLYIVHPLSAIAVPDRKGIGVLIIKSIVGSVLAKDIEANHIVYMDEDCSDRAIEYYGFNEKTKRKMKHIRVAVDPNNFTLKELWEKAQKKRTNILSVARADFPFKGYIIGLIKWFSENALINQELTLTIISYGSDFEKIVAEIKKLPELVKNRVTLKGKTDYFELKKYYLNSQIYVGMGTTVIEAAQYGCATIPVAYDSYELIGERFFCDDYRMLTADKNGKNKFNELFWKIESYSVREYYNHILNEYIAAKNYSSERTTNDLRDMFSIMGYNNRNIVRKGLGIIYNQRRKLRKKIENEK